MLSLPGGITKLSTTHGKVLLNELSEPSSASLETVLDCIRKDKIAPLLKFPKTGDNSFHLLLGSEYSRKFILPVLDLLLEVASSGLRVKNKSDQLPIHLYMCQNKVYPDIFLKLLEAYPKSASEKNGANYIPLYLCVMRDDSTEDICRALCKNFPEGPTVLSSTRSYPLHFAARRSTPNKGILKILLKRFPAAAAQMNDYGLLPLHCICSVSDDVTAVKMIYEAVREKDRQGRTCLHLAVLAVGKDHTNAVVREEEDMYNQIQLEKQQRKQKEGAKENGELSDYNFDDDDEEEVMPRVKTEMVERDGKSRAVIRFLIDCWPEALSTCNNFHSTPVETVLEKNHPVRTKKKIVSIFGLYDDPPTARLLLLKQQFYARISNSVRTDNNESVARVGRVISLNSKFIVHLRDLNWLARRDALLASYQGTTIAEAIAAKELQKQLSLGIYNMKIEEPAIEAEVSISKNKSGGKGKKKQGRAQKKGDSGGNTNDILKPAKNNYLARLRAVGLEELVREIIMWI